MKRLRFGLILVASSILLAGCVNKSTDQQVNPQDQSSKENESLSGNLKQLLGMNKSMVCTWQDSDTQGEGKTYISGEKYRSDVSYQQGSEMVTSSSINDGEWLYTWGNNMEKGSKYNLKQLSAMDQPAEEPAEKTDEQVGEYDNVTENDTQFNCQVWSEDSSIFTPPTEIEFIDMSSMMNQAQNSAEDMKDGACKLCNMLAEQDRADCLSACN